MSYTFCPECGHRLKLGINPKMGQLLRCGDCRANLEVIATDPVEIDLVPLDHRLLNQKKKASAIEAYCPECDHSIRVNSHIQLGQNVVCNACQTTLEVINTQPLELEPSMTNWKRDRRRRTERQNQETRRQSHVWD